MSDTAKNEAELPLNAQKKIFKENGVQRSIEALHASFKDSRCFTKYAAFLVNGEEIVNEATLDQWLIETEWFIKDMKQLLSLEYHKFWSTIVYNGSTLESIVSFMQNAVPFYVLPVLQTLENVRVAPLYTTAHTLVFKVICRLTDARESETCWMEEDFYGKLIYKNFIITVPFLFDMITVYGRDNKEQIGKILESILKLQPKYNQDLKHGLSYLLNAFNIIQTRCETDLIDANVSESTLNDLTLYAEDCCSILVQLVAISPSLRQICSELNVEFAISNFYDNVLIVLYRNIVDVNKDSRYLNHLNDMRVELLETFRSILSVQLSKILESSGDGLLAADKFISILTECLANSTFVGDYKNLYDIDDDLAIVQLGYKSVDQVKYDFIQKAYAKETVHKKRSRPAAPKRMAEVEPESFNDHERPSVQDEKQSAELEQRIEQNVQHILELLPDMDVRKVRKAVCSYDNVEEAVSFLLESGETSASAKREEEPIIPTDPLDEFYLRTGIDRLNIYDGDEFDVMVNDKVKGIIKKGKGMPGQPRTLNELLDDKSHLKQTRQFYRQYDVIAENDVNDDEYDDSFDAMAESESRHVRASKGGRNVTLLVDDELDNESDSDDEPEPDQEANRTVPLAFCENPELARKRYEEKLHSKYLRRHGSDATGPKTADVRGKPKGQGQDSKVLLNRRHKNENKALSGNHNRKQGANFKRSRGMMPS
uniref:CUE domain-containing protein n=1 Tax=Anopheles farauti TaxID=69004 RepID=A0A182QC44_9DIPT